MANKLNRRSFVTTLSGLGVVTLSQPFGTYHDEAGENKPKKGKKQLFATTDYTDNIIINHQGTRYGTPVERTDDYYSGNRCFMDKKQLDGLHQVLASLGVTRHQWIVDQSWTLYDDYPHGFDLLAEAAKSAHKYGIDFYAEYKPFEGGTAGIILPSTMPCPEGTGACRDIRGIFPAARRFEAAHPDLCLKRRTGTFTAEGAVTAIRLVKGDDRPIRLKPEHLKIWTSPTNNRFVRYEGPVSFRETIEKRYRFPYWRKSRILHLEELKVPEGHRYFLIKSTLADNNGNFGNEKGNLLELVNASGKIMPHTLSTGPVRLEDHLNGFYNLKFLQNSILYLKNPEVRAEISDLQKMEEHYRDFFPFGDYHPGDPYILDKEGYVAAVCGKPEFIIGQLHPIYPEVRNYWLNQIRFCLDRGADGMNIRISNHILSPEIWEYGFNDPVLRSTKGKTDFGLVSRINGNAYTLFLKEARHLIKSRGKSLVLHLESDLLMEDNRPLKISSYPFNFEWQWRTWVKEIGDEFEIRGIFRLRPWNLAKTIDVFSEATKAAGKPIYLQGDFHGLSFEGPYYSTEAELDLVRNHDGLDGYVLYETANFTRVNEKNEVEGSTEIVKVLNKHFFGK